MKVFERAAGSWALTAVFFAVAVVPLYFNLYAYRVYEYSKANLLKVFALSALVGLVGVAVARLPGKAGPAGLLHLLKRSPILAAVFFWLLVFTASTVFSAVPHESLYGGFQRQAGLLTEVSFIVLFVSVAMFLGRVHLKLLLQVLVLSSAAVSLYAILQRMGIDPVPWTISFEGRVVSSLGNPIFLSGYLGMTVLAALGLVCTDWNQRRKEAVPFLLVALLNTAALGSTGSRGPLLALLAGVGFFLLFAGARKKAVRKLFLLGTLAVAGLLILLSVKSGNNDAVLENVSDRYWNLLNVQNDTGRARVLVWQRLGELVSRSAGSMVLGHGPETMLHLFPSVYDSALGPLEGRRAMPDRAHNETWDLLVQSGLLGAASWYALVIIALGSVCRKIFQQGRRVYILLAAGCLCGGAAAAWAAGLAFIGLGMPLGLLAAAGACGLLGWRSKPQGASEDFPWLGAALASMLVVHFVEVQFGFYTISSRLLWWAALGGLCVWLYDAPRPMSGRLPPMVLPAAVVTVLGVSMARGLTMVSGYSGSVISAFLHPVLLAVTLAIPCLFVSAGVGKPSWRRRAVYVLIPVAVCFIAGSCMLYQAAGLSKSVGASDLHASLRLLDTIALTGLLLPLAFMGAGCFFQRGECRAGSWSLSGIGLLLVSGLLAARWIVPAEQAQMIFKVSDQLASQQFFHAGSRAMDAVLERQSRQTFYLNRAAVLAASEAGAAKNVSEQNYLTRRAVQKLDEAIQINRYSPDYWANRGRYLAQLASIQNRKMDRRDAEKAAWQSFEQAARSSPNQPFIPATKGLALLRLGYHAEAEEAFFDAIALDPAYALPYRHLGFLYSQRAARDSVNGAAPALDLEQAYRYLESAFALAEKDRFEEDHYPSRQLAYRIAYALGNKEGAYEHADRALALAPDRERESWVKICETLQQELGLW